MIMPPDEVGLPAGVGYQYTTFPELQDELFSLAEGEADQEQRNDRPRRKSDTFMFGSRTKQEIRTVQKVSVVSFRYRIFEYPPTFLAYSLLCISTGQPAVLCSCDEELQQAP